MSEAEGERWPFLFAWPSDWADCEKFRISFIFEFQKQNHCYTHHHKHSVIVLTLFFEFLTHFTHS